MISAKVRSGNNCLLLKLLDTVFQRHSVLLTFARYVDVMWSLMLLSWRNSESTDVPSFAT